MRLVRFAFYSAAWLIPLWLTGCTSDPDLVNCYHYYWGHYQIAIYDMYNCPEKNSPERLAALMEQDEVKAASLNKPLPPGFHAQLGYLYAQAGKTDLACREYQLERQHFPESAMLMDRMLGYSAKK